MGISGKDGTLYYSGAELSEVTKWTLERTCNVVEYGSNETGDGTTAIASRKRHSGSFECKGYPPEEGASAEAILYDGMLKIDTGTVVISGVTSVCDIDSGDVVGYTCNFVCNGLFTASSGSAP